MKNPNMFFLIALHDPAEVRGGMGALACISHKPSDTLDGLSPHLHPHDPLGLSPDNVLKDVKKNLVRYPVQDSPESL